MLAQSINKILFPLGIKISRLKNLYPVEASSREIEIINYILRLDNPKKHFQWLALIGFGQLFRQLNIL